MARLHRWKLLLTKHLAVVQCIPVLDALVWLAPCLSIHIDILRPIMPFLLVIIPFVIVFILLSPLCFPVHIIFHIPSQLPCYRQGKFIPIHTLLLGLFLCSISRLLLPSSLHLFVAQIFSICLTSRNSSGLLFYLHPPPSPLSSS